MAAGSASQPHPLPPLILHPFTEGHDTQALVAASRASLMLQGLLPAEGVDRAELERIVLRGRYCEIRMLFFIGKDLYRWMEQCLEFLARELGPAARGIGFGSLATLLVEDTPANVDAKLRGWGVVDYRAIFRRAIALRTLFAEPPDRTWLQPEFILHYHRYADALYEACWRGQRFERLDPVAYPFEVYSSGEYARLLEQQWGPGEPESF